MAKIWNQYTACPWGYNGSMAAGASTAGSFSSLGYAKLTGMIYSSCTLDAASGITIYQSCDGGTNWDYVAASPVSAGGTSVFSLEVYGDHARVLVKMGAASAQAVRTAWHLRPI